MQGSVPIGDAISGAGAFTWTPTEAQGLGSYPITVRVTDNGATLNAEEIVTVTVNLVAATPVTITLRPNAVGSSTELENSGTGGANWDRVDEVTADTTTYVYGDSSDNWQVDTYNVADQSITGTITNVRIYIRAMESADRPDDTYGRTAIRIGTGSIQYGTQLDLTTSYANYHTDYATKTGNLGGGDWTWTDINNLQIGVSLQSHLSGGGNWRYAQCTQVWVEITYIPA